MGINHVCIVNENKFMVPFTIRSVTQSNNETLSQLLIETIPKIKHYHRFVFTKIEILQKGVAKRAAYLLSY